MMRMNDYMKFNVVDDRDIGYYSIFSFEIAW